MEHISEAFQTPRKVRSGSTSSVGSGRARMEWGKDGLGVWVASLAEQVRGLRLAFEQKVNRVIFWELEKRPSDFLSTIRYRSPTTSVELNFRC